MKGIFIKLISLAMFFVVVFGTQVLAEEYIGECCWKVTDPENETSYVIGKFAVTCIGDTHFMLNGTFTNFTNDIQEGIDVAHGNAEIVGSNIIVTLVNTYYIPTEEYGFSVVNFQLNPVTLSGTSRTIDTAHQFFSGEITKEYVEGQVEFLSNCP
jgi:hypothetical protein